MITPKDKIGYIRRADNGERIEFKLIIAKVQRVVMGKKATMVYTKEFIPLFMEDVEFNTRLANNGRGLILVSEPFVIKDEQIPYFQAVVDDFNKNGAKSILDLE